MLICYTYQRLMFYKDSSLLVPNIHIEPPKAKVLRVAQPSKLQTAFQIGVLSKAVNLAYHKVHHQNTSFLYPKVTSYLALIL